jgi:hypothetical protein
MRKILGALEPLFAFLEAVPSFNLVRYVLTRT